MRSSIVRFNGSQSATLTVLGLKSEEEISGHDPLITIDMPADGSQPAFYLVGGYTYGRAGLHDVIKIINGKNRGGAVCAGQQLLRGCELRRTR